MREVIDEHQAIIAALAAQDSAAAAAAAQAHILSFRSALLHDGNPRRMILPGIAMMTLFCRWAGDKR